MVVVVQLVRTSDCGSEGRGFEPHLPPRKNPNILVNSGLGFLILRLLPALISGLLILPRNLLKCNLRFDLFH